MQSGFSTSYISVIKDLLAKIFGVKRLPDAATTLARMFNKLKSLKTAEVLSRDVWAYLVQLIPWKTIEEDWLTFDSSVLVRYGQQEGVKKGYNPVKHGRPSHSPLLAFLNRSKYVIHLWMRSGNVTSWNNILAFFTASYERIQDRIKVLGVIADSGFYLKQFIDRLEEEHLTYIIAVRLIRPLQRKIYSLTNWQEITHGVGCVRILLYPSSVGKRTTLHYSPAEYHPEKEGHGENLTTFCER